MGKRMERYCTLAAELAAVGFTAYGTICCCHTGAEVLENRLETEEREHFYALGADEVKRRDPAKAHRANGCWLDLTPEELGRVLNDLDSRMTGAKVV